MRRIEIPTTKVSYNNHKDFHFAKNIVQIKMGYAMKMSFEDLPKHVNHKDPEVKTIVLERLGGSHLYDPTVFCNLGPYGKYELVAFVLARD